VSDELLLNPFDYHPVLEIQSGTSFAVGLLPSHSNIGIVDQNGRSFRASCPPAMLQVKLDVFDQAKFGSLAAAISHTSLEIITRVILDFRNRPWTILRGLSYILRAGDPPVQASYIKRLSALLELGEPCAAQSAMFLDLSGATQHQLERAKQFGGSGDPAFLERVEKGIQIIREAAERDAKTAMATLAGAARDFEREMYADNREEIESLLCDAHENAAREGSFTKGFPVIIAGRSGMGTGSYVPMIDNDQDPNGQDGV
jgi:hypothetical protein